MSNKDNYFGKESVGVLFYAARSVLFILSQYLPLSSGAPEVGSHN